jgi:hypothetical protein
MAQSPTQQAENAEAQQVFEKLAPQVGTRITG